LGVLGRPCGPTGLRPLCTCPRKSGDSSNVGHERAVLGKRSSKTPLR